MASVRPELNNTHDLGTSTYKWKTLHSVDVQAATITTSGDVEIGGNLTVSGTQTVLDVTTVSVEDPLLQLAKSNSADSVDIGFYGQIVDGATTEYVGLYRDASDGKFKFFDNASAAPTTTVSGGSTATVVANIEGDLTGNADTATSAAALTTARTLSISGDASGSVSFDGSADADIALTIGSGAVENSMLANSTLTFSDGSNSEALALGATLEIGGTSSEVEVAYSAANNKFTVGLPDDVTIAGDLQVNGTINATIEGTSDQANALSTARTISLGGDLGGSASFDGSADITITATVQSGSVENSMLANDGFSLKLGGVSQEDINLGDDLNFAGTSNEVDIAYDSASNTLTFGLPSSISAALVGNASTASAWQTARTLSLGGDLGGSVSIDGSADATLTATIQSGSVENSMLANDGITVGDGTNSEEIALGGSFSIQGTSNEVEVAYSTANDAFTVGLPSSISGLTSVSATGFTGDLTGNADTATTLETARTLSISGDASGSVSFNGSADADIAMTIAAGAVENSMLANDGFSLKLGGVAQEDINLGDDLNFAGTSAEVDVTYSAASNTLTFGLPSTISAALSGNASTASAWQSARTLTLSGDLGGSVSIDGSADATLTATIQAASVENSMLANSSITFSDGSASEAIALGATLTIGGTSNEVEVSYDAATNKFTLGLPSTITAALNGNASTASALQTSRTIALSGDVTGSGSFDGSGDLTISATLAGGTALTFSDGSNSEALDLGSTVTIAGTSSEVDVAYVAGDNKFNISLPATINADTTGNASTASALETSRTLSLTGDVTGSGSFDGSGDLAISTTLAGGTALTFSDGTSSEALSLGSTLEIGGTSGEVEVAYSTASNKFTVGLPDDVTIAGDLQVNGTINATIEGVSDEAVKWQTARTLTLGGDLGGSVSIDGSADVTLTSTIQSASVENSMLVNDGITVSDGSNSEEIQLGQTLEFGGTTNEVEVAYSALNNKFTVGLPSTINAATTGNAATASAWQSARTLSLSGDLGGSVSIDGSADATLTATIQAGSVENSMLANDGITLTVNGTGGEDINLGDGLDFISTANETTIDYNASANSLTFGLPGTINADTSGNAATATALETARTLSVSGDASGSVSFDGTGDADIALTIASGAVENSMLDNSTISVSDGSVQSNIALGGGFTIQGTSNEVEVAQSGGAFTVGLPSTITAALNGNASTADAWSSSRTITLGGDLGGSVSLDGSADATLTATIQSGSVDNAMLANDGFSLLVDSVSQEDINLGDSLNFISGQDLDIAYNATTNQLSFALESEIDSDTTGNAATASAWATARTLSLGGDLGGSVSLDGSADATLTATIQSGSVENSMLANSTVTLAADSGSNDPVALGETITISGTSNEIETAAAGSNQITIGLPDNVTIGNNLTVSNDLTVSSGDVELTDGTLSILGGGASINGTVTINGTHTINGSLIANSATMKFEDSLLELGYTNTATVDHGFFSKHSDGEFVGNAYDQSASEFIFFKTDTKPSTTVDTGAAGFSYADARLKSLAASGSVQASGSLINNSAKSQFNKLSFASVSGTNTTLSGSQIVGGAILRDASNDETDATATAAQIVAAMPALARVADMTFEVKIIVSNSSAGYSFTAGSGVTIVGSSSYLVDGVHNYLVRVTNAASSSEAVTFYKA